MNQRELAVRAWLIRDLRRKKRATYASILENFELELTSNPYNIAYMVPGKNKIVINEKVSSEQADMLVRHEILHEFLKHEQRLMALLADELGKERTNLSQKDKNEIKKILYSTDLANVAGDYEISNRGYTEKDKQVARRIVMGAKVITGLVTEDKHPDWVNLSVEEMYKRLREEAKEQAAKPIQGSLVKGVFVSVDGRRYGKK